VASRLGVGREVTSSSYENSIVLKLCQQGGHEIVPKRCTEDGINNGDRFPRNAGSVLYIVMYAVQLAINIS
jgi:hypothetical protein